MIGIAALLHKTKDAVKRECTKCGIQMAETNVPWLLCDHSSTTTTTTTTTV